MGGEITMIDHVNCIPSPDRSDEHIIGTFLIILKCFMVDLQAWCPAPIRDVDLGTHSTVYFFRQAGMYKVPSETQYFQQIRNQPNQYHPTHPQSGFRLEDDFSFYLRQNHLAPHIDHEEGKLTCKKRLWESETEGLTGTQVFDFDSSLKFGREQIY